jgi:hypothetical protein
MRYRIRSLSVGVARIAVARSWVGRFKTRFRCSVSGLSLFIDGDPFFVIGSPLYRHVEVSPPPRGVGGLAFKLMLW